MKVELKLIDKYLPQTDVVAQALSITFENGEQKYCEYIKEDLTAEMLISVFRKLANVLVETTNGR